MKRTILVGNLAALISGAFLLAGCGTLPETEPIGGELSDRIDREFWETCKNEDTFASSSQGERIAGLRAQLVPPGKKMKL